MTERADITRLMANARIHLPGALDDALKLELFNVLDEFMKHTRCWREVVTFDTIADTCDYDLDPTEPGTVEALVEVSDSNRIPVGATMATPGLVVLNQVPSGVQTLRATLALTVVDPVDTNAYPKFPSWLLKKYGKTILEGLLGAMMSQAAKPYYNERLAVLHGRTFRGKLAQARSEVDRANIHHGQAWRFPQFA